jgi:hypothetical protein
MINKILIPTSQFLFFSFHFQLKLIVLKKNNNYDFIMEALPTEKYFCKDQH